MKKQTWKKHHKWLGLVFGIFLFMFCFSGIILNHRDLVSSLDISRTYLPSDFRYENWNNGILKGSIKLQDDCTVFLYGNAGIIKTDTLSNEYTLFNTGFPKGVDHRNIQAMHQLPDGTVYALGQFSLYKLQGSEWVSLFHTPHERLVDLLSKGNNLYVLSRSYLYNVFQDNRIELKMPKGYKEEVTLFRTIWLIHSGELFGFWGKIIVDLLAVVFILLTITGVLYWVLPKRIKRLRQQAKEVKHSVKFLKMSFNWHDKIGRYTIVLTLFIAFTGWCLRPPLLIPLAKAKVKPIPGTVLKSNNPWNDKLRQIEYDKLQKEWLLSTSEGFYTLENFGDVPLKLEIAPPVSVMGVNVMHQQENNEWLIGSFSGLFKWDRASNNITDYFTGDVPTSSSGMPFGKRAISGFTADLDKPYVIEYETGVRGLDMPASFKNLPMSLWNIALEIHTGRIYTILGSGTLIYISFAGFFVICILISGYVIRKKKKV